MRCASILTLVFSAASLPSVSPLRAETIGDFVVEPPASATLAGGGGGPANWLHVVNAPVTIHEAFTGESILDDGYGDVPAGTTLVFTFAPGALRNGPGTDLVFYDANPDSTLYRIRTSHDNFAQERFLLSTDFVDTGLDRDYYFGGAGPTSYDIIAGELDLSSFDIPPGTSVEQVRLFTEGPLNDPLGVGAVQAAVPTVSAWGLAILCLLVLAAGSTMMKSGCR